MVNESYDFKKEWPKIKKELGRLSQEAMVLAKKGEKELIKFSQRGKTHLDITTLNLKKEHVYYLIGREYVKAKCPGEQTSQLKKFVEELNKIDGQITDLKKGLTGQASSKKSSRKAKKS